MGAKRSSLPFFQRYRALLHHRGGVAAVEFAMIAPIMVACLMGVYDLGNALQQQIHLQQAVRAGGLYAISHPPVVAAGVTGITSVIKAAVPDWSNLSVNTTAPWATLTCQCWTSPSTYSPVSADVATCTVTCTSPATMQRFVSVQASRPFTGLFYNLPGSSASYVARLQ